jgi:hypothetical protein
LRLLLVSFVSYLGKIERNIYNFRACAEWLLAHHMETLFNSLDGLLSMNRRRTCNDDCLQGSFFSEQLVVVEVCSHAGPFSLCGVELGLHGRADCDELGARSQSSEMASMAQT